MFSRRFSELRKKHGMTQNELAEILSMSVRAIAAWESGERKPPIDKLVRLADYYNVSTDYLLGRTDNPQPYIYEGSHAGDGRKAVLSGSQSGLSPKGQEQVGCEPRRAFSYASSVSLKDSDLTFDELFALIQQIVDQSLEKRGRQGQD